MQLAICNVFQKCFQITDKSPKWQGQGSRQSKNIHFWSIKPYPISTLYFFLSRRDPYRLQLQQVKMAKTNRVIIILLIFLEITCEFFVRNNLLIDS